MFGWRGESVGLHGIQSWEAPSVFPESGQSRQATGTEGLCAEKKKIVFARRRGKFHSRASC